MKELGLGSTPQELIPGFPEDLERLANRLSDYSEGAATSVVRLRSLNAGIWVGGAAEAFSELVSELPGKLSRAAVAFQDAALALRVYAAVSREAQAVASRAIELFEEGDRRSRSWRLGEDQASSARVQIAAAQPPSSLQQIDDPGQSLQVEARHLLERSGVTHPVAFAKAVVDWDTWVESRGRAIGHLIPAILLTAATAGAGAAGKGTAAAEALEGAGARQTAEMVQAAAAGEVREAIAGSAARSGGRALVNPDKYRYLFGEVESDAHNAARSAQNLAQMERLGLRGSNGRSLLQAHLDAVVRDPTNLAREFSNQYGTFQIRESLFAGPSGAFAKFETTWQVMRDGSLRLTTLPFGGR